MNFQNQYEYSILGGCLVKYKDHWVDAHDAYKMINVELSEPNLNVEVRQ